MTTTQLHCQRFSLQRNVDSEC